MGWCKATKLVLLLAVCGIAGCAAWQPRATPPPTPVTTPVTAPTVPPRTETPAPPTPVGGTPLSTRPLENLEAAKAQRAGKPIGPLVTFAGISRADGHAVEPQAQAKNGIPVFLNYVGSGFQVVVEAKRGLSNLEVGRRILAYDPDVPSERPDLEIQADRNLGDGSAYVCDARRPHIGGVPGINPPSFKETKEIAAALNDLSCRFETFIESASSCTVNKYGDFSFLRNDSTVQFCLVVAKSWNFPVGDTLVSVRVRDSKGNPGPVAQFYLRRPSEPPLAPTPRATPPPTPPRRRP